MMASGWPGQILQVGRQVVGIVGQRIEIALLHHQSAGIVGGLDVDRGRARFRYRHLLGLRQQHERDIERTRLPGGQRGPRLFPRIEPRRGNPYGNRARREPIQLILALRIRTNRLRDPPLV